MFSLKNYSDKKGNQSCCQMLHIQGPEGGDGSKSSSVAVQVASGGCSDDWTLFERYSYVGTLVNDLSLIDQ